MKSAVKRVPIIAISTLLISMVVAGCTFEYPYLELEVEPIYTGQYISFSYRFQSESRKQPCQIYVDGDVDYDQDATLVAPEEISFRLYDSVKLPNEGVIVFRVNNTGTYTLYFNVLSSKGLGEEPLYFLREARQFEVQP